MEASIPSGFRDSAGADTAGANSDGLVGLSNNHADPLKVRIPSSVRQIVGMTDPMTIHWTFITNFAARHEGSLPSVNRSKV